MLRGFVNDLGAFCRNHKVPATRHLEEERVAVLAALARGASRFARLPKDFPEIDAPELNQAGAIVEKWLARADKVAYEQPRKAAVARANAAANAEREIRLTFPPDPPDESRAARILEDIWTIVNKTDPETLKMLGEEEVVTSHRVLMPDGTSRELQGPVFTTPGIVHDKKRRIYRLKRRRGELHPD